MTFQKKSYVYNKNNKKVDIILIDVCCEKLANEEEINKQDSHWDTYGDGVYQVRNISFCPFCGSKLL